MPQPPYNTVLRFRDDGTGPLAEQVAREWARFTTRGVTGAFVRHPTGRREAGATMSVLHATPMSHDLYAAIGYRDVAVFGMWAEPATLHL